MAAADSGTNQTPFLTPPPRAGKEDDMTCEHEQTQYDDLAKAIVLLLAAPKEWLPEITALIELFKDAACVECTALPGGQVRCTITIRRQNNQTTVKENRHERT